MKHIVIFGAGKSSIYLIEYLIKFLVPNRWRMTVVDADENVAKEKTGNAANTYAASVEVTNSEQRRKWVAEADVVVSLMPPALHFLLAIDCLEFRKHLLTASYVDERMRSLHEVAVERGLLFLCECGLDPGIDHMSAMSVIEKLKKQGAAITSFMSHCGGLMAPEYNDNPWKYKISWNSRNIVLAGKQGAVYRENDIDKRMLYEDLFDPMKIIDLEEPGPLCWYPNRDSLGYIELYGLEHVSTFIRTTLRYPEFCFGWKNIIDLKLTDEDPVYETDGMSLQHFFQLHMKKNEFSEWMQKQFKQRFDRTKLLLDKLSQLMEAEEELDDELRGELQDFMMVDDAGNLMDINLEDVKLNAAATVAVQMQEANLALKQLFFLGMDDNVTMINKGRCSAADILQFAMERKLALKPGDKDMIVMLHELKYEMDGEQKSLRSQLVLKGEDDKKTAMAKTVGLPLAIATRMVLNNEITRTGVCIPVTQDIYSPILSELENCGIVFKEEII